jgi:hypothetical protein
VLACGPFSPASSTYVTRVPIYFVEAARLVAAAGAFQHDAGSCNAAVATLELSQVTLDFLTQIRTFLNVLKVDLGQRFHAVLRTDVIEKYLLLRSPAP